MSQKLIGSCVIGQSGGPTAVINASVYGAVKAALAAPEITHVYGASHGIVGILNDMLYVLDKEDEILFLIYCNFYRHYFHSRHQDYQLKNLDLLLVYN